MGTGKTTLELRIELAAKEARESVVSLNAETVRLAATMRDMNMGTKVSQESLKRLEGFTKQAAQQMSVFGVNTGDLKKQQTALQSTVRSLLNDGLEPESKAVQELVKRYKDLGAQSGEIDKLNNENIDSFDKLKSAITQSAAAVALIKVAQKGIELGKFALESADSFQKARNEFGILLGDMKAGAGLFDRIKKFNDVTPFDLATTKQGVNVLLAAEVPISRLNDRLTMFGDLSQGNSQKFTSFINAFSKGSAKGAVDMEVLNVYLDQGIPILEELANAYDTTKAGVIDMASKGKVSFEDFSAALERLTAEGGGYYGGMALGSKDLSAMQEGLNESVTGLAASFGQMLIPAMQDVLSVFTSVVNAINESPLMKGLLAGALVGITGYLAAMAVKQSILAVKTWIAYAAQMGFNSALAVTNPLLLAGIAAAAAATVAIVYFATKQQESNKQSNEAAIAAYEQTNSQKLLEKSTITTTAAVEKQTEKIYDWKKSIEDFTGSTRSLEEYQQKMEYLKKTYNGFTNEFGAVEFAGLNKGQSKVVSDLEANYIPYKTDPFGESYELFKQARSEFSKFIEESAPKLSKLQLLDVEKAKYDAAAIAAFSGAEQDKNLGKINEWYKNSRAEIEKETFTLQKKISREATLSAHADRMKAIKDEWEYQRELARKNIEDGDGKGSDYLNYVESDVMVQASQTDAGQIALGTDPITMLISSLVEAAMELENVNKLLNFMGTFVDSAFTVIGPLLDGTAADFVDVIIDIGTTFGSILAPFLGVIAIQLKLFAAYLKITSIPLQLLGKGFEWFYNSVVVVVANKIVGMINSLIHLINKIPGIDIDKLGKLSLIGDAAENLAEDITAATDKIKDAYDSKIQAIQDFLDAQVDSLKKQYELGLINRDEYESKAAEYHDSANDAINDLDTERNRILEEIKENTDLLESYLSTNTIIVPESIAAKPVSTDQGDNPYIRSFGSFSRDVSSSNLSTINYSGSSDRTIVYLTVQVAGSVTTEKELVSAIHDGICKGSQIRRT